MPIRNQWLRHDNTVSTGRGFRTLQHRRGAGRAGAVAWGSAARSWHFVVPPFHPAQLLIFAWLAVAGCQAWCALVPVISSAGVPG